VPSPAWKQKKYGQPWALYDTVNATIGQGYMLANPLQLAVMAGRLATGNNLMPRLLLDKRAPAPAALGFSAEDIRYVRQAMSDVVNGPGTAGRAKLPVENVLMAGKTGTAQVVGLNISSGKGGLWKYRDHGLFIFFAPFDNPRYAGAVVIEHGGGSGAAYPIARDVMTFMFDPEKGMAALHELEKGWGGTAIERMAIKYAAAERLYGGAPPKPVSEAQVERAAAAAPSPTPTTVQTEAASPAPEPVAAPTIGASPLPPLVVPSVDAPQ
jgi:penicillin-binding protein 2